jgi:hypothetical protein
MGQAVNIFNITSVEHVEVFRNNNSDSVSSNHKLITYHTNGARTGTVVVIGTYEKEIYFTLKIHKIYKIFNSDFCTKGTHNGTQNPMFQTL